MVDLQTLYVQSSVPMHAAPSSTAVGVRAAAMKGKASVSVNAPMSKMGRRPTRSVTEPKTGAVRKLQLHQTIM